MDRAKLLQKRAELEKQANALLNQDETREYGPEQQRQVDALLGKIDAITRRLASMDAMARREEEKEKDDDEDGEGAMEEGGERDDDEDGEGDGKKKDGDGGESSARGRRSAPAYVRSRGRRSAPADVNEYARREGFSIARAVTQFLTHGQLRGVEADVSQELQRTGTGSNAGGAFRVPLGAVRKLNGRMNTRADLTLTTGAGAVPVITDGSEFIDYLYPMMVGPQLGFRYIEGLQGVTKFPRQSGVPTVAAVAEQAAAAGSAPGIDYVQFTPHTITANVTISRKFAQQSVVAADQYVMQAGARQVAVQLDQWAISGDGASNRPTGLVNNAALTQFQIAGSNAFAYGDALAMRKQVAASNALFGKLGWLTSPAGYAKLSQTPKIGSTFPVFLINDEGEILGEKCVQSSQVSANVTYSGTSGLTQLVFGNWEFLAVALFGNGLDVIVDPYTGSKSGDVTITFLLDADTNLLQPGAFSVCPNVGE